MRYTYSSKKQKLIDGYETKVVEVGDVVSYKTPRHHDTIGRVAAIDGDKCFVKNYYGHKSEDNEVDLSTVSHYLYFLGENPFAGTPDLRPVNYTLESILSALLNLRGSDIDRYFVQGISVERGNFNPVIFDGDGEIVYYQRGNVWALENKQSLVESIYAGVDCGKVIVRKRSFKELEYLASKGITELGFNDVVDGKQRITTIKEFIEDKFVDTRGNLFSDLSDSAQHAFLNNQLISYAEMAENTKDGDVVQTFLKMNFSGIPQSVEHLEYLRSLKI